MVRRLKNPNINKGLILWIRQFLSCFPHRLCVGGNMSDVFTVSNGCQQGCVLSPALFPLFTNSSSITDNDSKLIKYADKMAFVGLQKNRLLRRSCTLGQHKGFEILVLHQPTCNQRCKNDRIDILHKTGCELPISLIWPVC